MASRRYLNFDLLLEQEGEGRYQARVTDSPLGESPSVRFQLPFDATTLENLLLKLDPGRSGTRRVGATGQQQAAMDFGGPLYDAVFTGDLALAWQRSMDRARAEDAGGLRLRLRLKDAPAIAGLPWELLYDAKSNSFLAQSERTPVVRFLDVPQVPRPMTVDGPLRILAIISSPIDLEELDVEAEWKRINESLKPRIDAGEVVVDRLASATVGQLGDWLREHQTHVIHFVGHGDFDAQLREGVIYFQDNHGKSSPVTSSVLGPFLRDHDPLRMVVLNACRSARSDAVDPFAGIAQGLVQQDATAVVAMQFPISDRAAVTFTGEFYGALVEGFPVDQAVSSARKALLADYRDEWSTPVLFMRSPDGNIFENVHALAAPDRPVPEPAPPPPPPPGPGPFDRVLAWVRTHPGASAAAAVLVVLAVVAAFVVPQLGHDGSTDNPTDPTSGPTTEPTATGSGDTGERNGEGLPGGPELKFDEMLVAAGDTTQDLRIYRVKVGSTEPPVPLTDGEDAAFEQGPALGPKRDTIVFTAVQVDGSKSLRVSAPDGSRQQALFPESMDFCSRATERPAWPKGGERRVVTVCREPGAQARLLLLGFDGEVKRDYEIDAGNFGDPAVNPRTGMLMFWANDRPTADGGFLFQVPLTGGTPERITADQDPGDAEADPDQDSDAVFSPDGNLIAFRRTDLATGNRDIWVANADGSEARQVTFSGTADQDPTFAPDSDFIAYKHDETNATGIRTGDTRIYIIPVTPPGAPPAAPIPMLDTPIADIETLPAWSRR